MEESHDQHRHSTAPMAYPPAYSLPQPPYVAAMPVPRAGFWAKCRRAVRLLLRRALYRSVLIGRVMRPYAAFIVVVMLLLGVIGWMGLQLWAPKAAAPQDVRVELMPPAAAVESFIKGQQSFDADMMWDAYSADYQAAQLQRGASKATLQAQVDNERLRGLQYVHYDYIGGVKLDDGRSMYFYAVDLALQSQRAKLPLIFTANAEGKIEEIASP